MTDGNLVVAGSDKRGTIYGIKQYLTSDTFAPRKSISSDLLRTLFKSDKKQNTTDAMSIYE